MAKKRGASNHVGIVGKEYINVYSKDNPILEPGDKCYFLFTNLFDYHRPLVAYGEIIEDRFSDGMNKEYYMKILEILESPVIIDKFVNGKNFYFHDYIGGDDIVVKNKKMQQVNKRFDYSEHLLKIESFFVRKEKEKIYELLAKYIQHIKKDVERQLKDIQELIAIETR